MLEKNKIIFAYIRNREKPHVCEATNVTPHENYISFERTRIDGKLEELIIPWGSLDYYVIADRKPIQDVSGNNGENGKR